MTAEIATLAARASHSPAARTAAVAVLRSPAQVGDMFSDLTQGQLIRRLCHAARIPATAPCGRRGAPGPMSVQAMRLSPTTSNAGQPESPLVERLALLGWTRIGSPGILGEPLA